jgi:hypothetical protein
LGILDFLAVFSKTSNAAYEWIYPYSLCDRTVASASRGEEKAAMATDPLRRLEEELRQVENPNDLPPDLLYALQTLAAAFGTSLEAMRDRIILASSRDEPIMGFMTSLPTGRDAKSGTRLATLVVNGDAVLPKRAKRRRTRDDLIPVEGLVSDLVIEDRR